MDPVVNRLGHVNHHLHLQYITMAQLQQSQYKYDTPITHNGLLKILTFCDTISAGKVRSL